MIRMIQSSSASHAKAYFSDALLQADYYLNDQELQGRLEGRLAERLGVAGPATKETFFALCENRQPGSASPLTPRTKADRITGYDINFHCPKSVSILHGLSGDSHILEAFEESVRATMRDIEADSKTRVRKGGRQEDRDTGELAWAQFTHQTARPVDDRPPDPHLHAHCFVFNATWDREEQGYKAAKFRDIKRDMPYYQARFHKRLSDNMIRLGYRVRRTPSSFEIEGVPQAVLELFSKRTDEIGRVAKEKGIHNPKDLDALGARTRSKKQKGLGMKELKAAWRGQILELGADGASGDTVRHAGPQGKEKADPQPCLDHALKHCFERASVMPGRRILETAYHYALGHSGLSIEGLSEAFTQDGRIIHVRQGGRQLCTTREVLAEEKRMVELARQGMNRLTPLYREVPDLSLNEQQAEAVRHVLTTGNRVSIIRGAAGTGKTTLMRQAADLIEKAGKQLFVAAPTAEAARGVLKDEGFAGARTVAELLLDKSRHKELKDQVIWVDEAGLLGTRDMRDILELATQQNARVILGGDTRQHASVVRGDALRVLNTVGGIKAAEVSRIIRQRDADYRKAVEDLAQGKVAAGFERLDQMGAIREVDPLNPNVQLVEDYFKAVKAGKTALVISPTHKQGEEVTGDIRARLKAAGMIGKREITARKLSNLNLTEAEKGDWRKFQPGQVVQFNQNVPGMKRGSAWRVLEAQEGKVTVEDDQGHAKPLPLKEAGKFDLFAESQMPVAKGDRIRITRNGFDRNERRLNNGQTLEVAKVRKNGEITLKTLNGRSAYKLDAAFGHLDHAHCLTSYAAQGKTVDEVFIAQPAATFAATDARQFYVSVSRGRDAAHLYTDDKEGLLDYAQSLGERQSALELVTSRKTQTDYVIERQRAEPGPKRDRQQKDRTTDRSMNSQKDRDYEPGI